MGHVTLNQIVENKFSISWGATTPIKYENIAFTPPEGSSWVSIAVKESDSQKITLGSGQQLRRTIGTVFVEIYTPVGIGSVQARTYSDSIKAIFRDFRLSGLHLYEGDSYTVGEMYYTNSGTGVPATSQQYQIKVAFPFRYDEYL